MPNPSTITAGLYDQLEAARARYNNLGLSKASREAALAQVRSLEAELDLPADERTPNHNGRPAQPKQRSDLHQALLVAIDALTPPNNEEEAAAAQTLRDMLPE